MPQLRRAYQRTRRPVRAREKRIEQVVAVVATVLVVGVAVVTSGATLFEGIAAYAIVGASMYYLARRTFV